MPRRDRWIQEGVFEPDELRLMGEAYERVLTILRGNPGPYATIPPDQCRALIADAILIGARRGHRDADRLEQQALKSLASFAARQDARHDYE